MADRLNWGILGTGNIARQFAEGVSGARRSRVCAVGSRTREAAAEFAKAYAVERSYGSYAELLADDAVEAVYVSLPNSMHAEWTIRALEAGKHVLCEKPMATSVAEAEQMFDASAKADRILVEAFMYRSHPLTQAVVREVRSGAIGKLQLIRTSFCYRTRKIEGNIRFDAELAGGALMDIGCYCIDLACLLADAEPTSVNASGHVHETGVDERAVGTLAFENDVLADFACGMTVQADNTALICGDEGYIAVPVPWKPAVRGAEYVIKGMTPPRQDGGALKAPEPTVRQVDAELPLFGLEADAFARTVLDGEPAEVTREQTLRTMRVLDEARRQVMGQSAVRV
ncbi:Gfo/Idh/MocA family protein [Phycisphaerales bacterium AB-hyl4]|uniref:Gfo/Idh/MocA family protein n=1 Tax=Natronomicrosphaera hydrolytica TaxID=3242702 RepID=A0ABV4U9W6_9BACT